MSALHVTGLSAGYGAVPIVRDVSLPELKAGEVTSLIGPNGAGKSTLLRALAGLLSARGSVLLGEQDLLGMPVAERSKLVTYMPQTLPQGVALSVLETVIGALRASPHSVATGVADDPRIALEILQRIGIEALAMQRLDQLSGGQRQLVSLAQALVRAPRMLLLDEPTSALDLRYQLRVMNLVRDVARERGMIVLVVLHDLHTAARSSDRIVVLSRGEIAAAGMPRDAITPEMLAAVYHVRARVEARGDDDLLVMVDSEI